MRSRPITAHTDFIIKGSSLIWRDAETAVDRAIRRGVPKMGSRAMVLGNHCNRIFNNFNCKSSPARLILLRNDNVGRRNFSTASKNSSFLEPPDVPRLAETARISLTPHEAEEFAPKIRQVVDWFGQLQAVDLQTVEPSIRADTEGDNFRDDIPETFENREAIIAGVPNYEEPYMKVPKILNKE